MTEPKSELREIECESPIDDIQIGTVMPYGGMYITGYESGESPIKRIYCVVSYLDDKIVLTDTPLYVEAELENSKILLLGFLRTQFRPEIKIPEKFLNK